MTHVMIDLETLGTKAGCAIVSIGACVFGPRGIGENFYGVIDVESTTLAIDGGTVKWWMGQSEEARAVFGSRMGVPHVNGIHAFINWWKFIAKGTSVWAAPAHFDVPILEAGIRAASCNPPWTHRDVRDAKTIYAIAGVRPDMSVGTAHNALDDAIAQAEAAIKAMNKIGWPQ